MSTPTEALAKQFSRRLHSALDQMGLSAQLLERSSELGEALGIDISLSSLLLSGKVLPSWEIFHKLCSYTSRQPGYFLDAKPQTVPENTRIAKPLGAGENLVIRIPGDAPLSSASGDDWTYLKAKESMGFGVVTGDFVVSHAEASGIVGAIEQGHYLLGFSDHFEIRYCKEHIDGRAVLTGGSHSGKHGADTPLILQTTKSHKLAASVLSSYGVHYMGAITAIVRGAETLKHLS